MRMFDMGLSGRGVLEHITDCADQKGGYSSVIIGNRSLPLHAEGESQVGSISEGNERKRNGKRIKERRKGEGRKRGFISLEEMYV